MLAATLQQFVLAWTEFENFKWGATLISYRGLRQATIFCAEINTSKAEKQNRETKRRQACVRLTKVREISIY
jgi:hypothetical protein